MRLDTINKGRAAKNLLLRSHSLARKKTPRFAAQHRAKRGGSFLIYRRSYLVCAAPALCAYAACFAVTPASARRAQSANAAAEASTPGTIGWIAPMMPGADMPVMDVEVDA